MDISIDLSVLRSNVINQVQFYQDLSLEITIDLSALWSNVINRVQFYADPSSEISIDLKKSLRSILINKVKFYPATRL